MLHAKIALIDQTNKIPFSYLSRVAAALQTQATHHLAAHWPVSATVVAMSAAAKPAVDVWPIYIVESLPAGEGGYHWTKGTNQPYSVVANGPGWTVAASHEMVEMCCDPSGNRLQTAQQITLTDGKQGLAAAHEAYLVEVADPCENEGYEIDGIGLSDFILPSYYLSGTSGLRYSFLGSIKGPMQILPGGYISYLDQATNHMCQITWFDPSKPPQKTDLGPASAGMSLKQFVDSKTDTIRQIAQSANHKAVLLMQAMGVQQP